MTRFRGEYVADRKAVHNAARASVGNRCIRCGHPEGDRMWTTADVHRVIELEAMHSRALVWEKFGGKEWERSTASRCMGGPWMVTLPVPCTERCTHPKDGKLRILTVHHLTGQKDDNRWWNLLPLCQSCHLTIQGKVIPEQAYLHPHTPWFVPYVCGFYAATIGGMDITREEADADPHRWLKLGQPWLYSEVA